MGSKSYLSNQIRLPSLTTYDFFTEEEAAVYAEAIAAMNAMGELDAANKRKTDEFNQQLNIKKQKLAELSMLCKQHAGTPRKVRLSAVLRKPDKGVTWQNLKLSKKITEFESDMSRSMGLKPNDWTLDKLIISWKSLDVLEQLVLDGFVIEILLPDDTVEERQYEVFTASAGQLRTDKVQCLSVNTKKYLKAKLECGLSWEVVNAKGGCNVNKKLAYDALSGSSTDWWKDFDIDRCIVIPDWKGEVTDRMTYIKPDYTMETGIRTVEINHVDGAGMMLPSVSTLNFMVRGPFVKGLLCSFDFLRFCKINNAKPIIKDAWGKEHDLVKENITIIFTESQLKMWKFYDSWEDYKRCYKEAGCAFGKMNYEEKYIKDTTINYQMLQTLTDFTDQEIKEFTAREHDRIKNLAENKESMLRMLSAEEGSDNPFQKALWFYPELLRDGYARKLLKDIKKKMILDAKSGAIQCQNKRLFAIPDWYAACEYYFLHEEHPKGLLENGQVSCKPLRRHDKADVLRSPHLYMEHCVRNIVHNQEVYDWFYTNGIYTSCHDLISRVLQFDVDGDQLNVITDPVIITVAERNLKEFDVVPLFYDANKAPAEILTRESLFNGLKRAHNFSSGAITSIGEISNMLTKLWNKDHPDREAAALLCYKNNLVIDAAKTGEINDYTNYPSVARKINKAVGGKRSHLPYFFQFTKNGRKNNPGKKKRKWLKPNRSTMNRISAAFDDIGNINMNFAGIAPFNWQMMLSEPCLHSRPDIVNDFTQLSSTRFFADIDDCEDNICGSMLFAEEISEIMKEKYGSLEECYPYIVKGLFAGDAMVKSANKLMFWKVFGDIAIRIIMENAESADICPECSMRIPAWIENHHCIKNNRGFYECVDCGKICERTNSRQCRCAVCQEHHRASVKLAYKKEVKKELAERSRALRLHRLIEAAEAARKTAEEAE